MKTIMTILSFIACFILVLAALSVDDEDNGNAVAKTIILAITTVIALDVVCMWN